MKTRDSGSDACGRLFEEPSRSFQRCEAFEDAAKSCLHFERFDVRGIELIGYIFVASPCQWGDSSDLDCTIADRGILHILLRVCDTRQSRVRTIVLKLSSDSDYLKFWCPDGKQSREFSTEVIVRPRFKQLGQAIVSIPLEFIRQRGIFQTSIAINGSGRLGGLNRISMFNAAVAVVIPPMTNRQVRVFVSYARDSERRSTAGLELPVDAVVETLSELGCDVLRDRKVLAEGDSLHRFVSLPRDGGIDLLCVVGSPEYWTSWYCMFEFVGMAAAFNSSARNVRDSLIMLFHPGGDIGTNEDIQRVVKYWRAPERISECPAALLANGETAESISQRVANAVAAVLPEFHSVLGNSLVWDAKAADTTRKWLVDALRRVGSPFGRV